MYTVLNSRSEVLARGATLEDAAREILGHDSHVWEIRGCDLWRSHVGRNNHCFSRFAGDDGLDQTKISGLTEREIYQGVIDNASWFEDCEIMTDETYAASFA